MCFFIWTDTSVPTRTISDDFSCTTQVNLSPSQSPAAENGLLSPPSPSPASAYALVYTDIHAYTPMPISSRFLNPTLNGGTCPEYSAAISANVPAANTRSVLASCVYTDFVSYSFDYSDALI